MIIYTSYFGNIKRVREAGLKPLAIVRYMPRWLSGVTNYQRLAPSHEMLKSEKWQELYRRYLNSLKPEHIMNDLEKLAGGETLCLFCYEKPPDPCHRHIVAEWLTDSGIIIEEFQSSPPPPEPPKEPAQTSLF